VASGPHSFGHSAGHIRGHHLVLAIDLNPLDWLGGAVAGAAADGWKAAMIGLWSAGLWLLQLSFKIIDAFTTPDVSSTGPLAQVLPTTLWMGLFVVTLMMLLQLAVALVRRDGNSLGRIFAGILQFGLVWLSYLVVAGSLIVAAGGLTKGILHALLHIDSWSAFSASSSWPRSINDATAASVLGITSILLLIPASFGYLLIMLVREAALVILIATAPITAAGLVNDTSKVWFWKSLVHRQPAHRPRRRPHPRCRGLAEPRRRRRRRDEHRRRGRHGGRGVRAGRDRCGLPDGAVQAAGVRRTRHRLRSRAAPVDDRRRRRVRPPHWQEHRSEWDVGRDPRRRQWSVGGGGGGRDPNHLEDGECARAGRQWHRRGDVDGDPRR